MTDQNPYLRNAHLDGSPFFWASGDVAVLCLHGFTATTVEVRKIAKFLHDNGYTVEGPLLPGHGSTPLAMNKTRWQDWFAAAEESLKKLAANYRKVFVLGESMGGLLTLHLAAKYPDISGILLFAPAVKISNLWLSKILWPFIPSMKKKPPDNDIPQQSYNAFPMRAAASLFNLQRIVLSELPIIQTPVRIFQGKLDDTINPIGAVMAYERIGSEDKNLIILSESCHLILLDKQLVQVQEFTLEFLKEVLAENP